MSLSTQHFIIFFLYLVEFVICSGPDFSDIRFLGNNGYRIPSQAMYKKVYGGNGKRYGVHFPAANEGFGTHNAHDKDPGGIDYKDFGWNYRKYIYPKILPMRHHYDGNAIYDDPGQGTTQGKEKPKINLYIYNFDKESENNDRKKKVKKHRKSLEKTRKKWRKRRPVYYKHRDPYDIYEPVKRDYPRYEININHQPVDRPEHREEADHKKEEAEEEDVEKDHGVQEDKKQHHSEDDPEGDEKEDYPRYAESITDLAEAGRNDDYRAAVVRRRQLSRTYDVSAGTCGYKEKSMGHCWGLEPQLYSHPNPMCYIQCDNMGNTFIRMCAKGTLWRARDYASYNACA